MKPKTLNQNKFLLLLFFSLTAAFVLNNETLAQSKKATANLPKDIKWQTAKYEPILASPKAKKGGSYRTYLQSYPLTFRLYGPNSNSGGFTSYNRRYAFWGLTQRHPNTSQHLPELATHWSLAKDQKTAYFKLDQAARWSDGEKITADDYVFAHQFLQSKFIQAPFYNQYIRDNIASVEKIDTHTLKIVSVKPSWRLLDLVSISPLPKHAIKLDETWVKSAQWKPNVVPGPYVLKKFKKNQFIEFHRIKDWWGKDRPEYKNQFNFNIIRLDVVRNSEIAYELFKKKKLDIFSPTEIQWIKKTDFSDIKKGYILKHQYPIETWTGLRGIIFNTQDALWSDKNLRIALAYTIDFDNINKNYLYSFNTRKTNFFDVEAPYKTKQTTYPFDLTKSNQILEKAGWKRSTKERGIRYKNGKRLKLKLLYAAPQHNTYLGNIKNNALKAGIDLELALQDGSAFFKAVDSGTYQALLLFFGGGRYPAPRQFLHTENKKPGTNNLFLFGNEKLDEIIETYEFDLDEQKRIQAISEIEKIASDNAILIHFWKRPFQLFLRWKNIQAPDSLGTKRGIDFDLLWNDSAINKSLEKR